MRIELILAPMGHLRRRLACPHGPQARKRSAPAWAGIDSYRAVKMPATSRQGLAKPQETTTTRQSCPGGLTVLALTHAWQARALWMVSGGRSGNSSSKSVSGSVRGSCLSHFSWRRRGQW
jgi:hypothetical protein